MRLDKMVLSGWISSGRITPDTCTYSSPFVRVINFSPRTTRFPLGNTFTTLTVMSPPKLLFCVCSPPPTFEYVEPKAESVDNGKPPGDANLPNCNGDNASVLDVRVMVLSASLDAAVASRNKMVIKSPTRYALRSPNKPSFIPPE